ncbi:YybH family protein [Phenylobacterium soli]|uniref:DUF4440 domain-containing protein n=1 Tax=Phenylobacterium soli TaxID=2170551 RepID=A0A328AHW0_9CAUL|nr:nuclear transport factor 2 family protein [Phenylobacterium soli]RAK54095.1 DUF4440 domain-containing protein [Phenylobacterium soli]
MTPTTPAWLAATAVALGAMAPTIALSHPSGAAPAARHAWALAGEAAAAARVVDAFHAALKTGEPDKAAALLASDVLVFEAGGAERSKADYAAAHLAADAKFEGAAESTPQQRTGAASGGLAWIATEGRVRSQSGEKVVDRLTTETMILRRTPEGWRIVHIHWSSRAASPPLR